MVTSLFHCHRVGMIYFHKSKKRQKRNCSCNIFARSWTGVLFVNYMLGITIKVPIIFVHGILTSLIKYSKYFDNVFPQGRRNVYLYFIYYSQQQVFTGLILVSRNRRWNGKKKIYNRQMKMTVYEDRLDQARKDNKGDDKKEGKIARRKTLFITFHTHVVGWKGSRIKLLKKENVATPLRFYVKMSTDLVFQIQLCGGNSY